MTTLVAGVDGCPAGWLVALAPADRPDQAAIRIVGRLAELIDRQPDLGPVAVDIPIGLPDRVGAGGRAAETAVRPLLGARQSSVFSVPSRAAVYAPDYAAACMAALASSDPPRRVSKQCFHLFAKIREVDALLAARPGLAASLHEVHPEVAFWRLNGARALATPKKVKGRPHEPGLAERRALLAAAGFNGRLLAAPPPAGAGPDDVLDALANLAIARRLAAGLARPFPDPPPCDGRGLAIAIWA